MKYANCAPEDHVLGISVSTVRNGLAGRINELRKLNGIGRSGASCVSACPNVNGCQAEIAADPISVRHNPVLGRAAGLRLPGMA